jgi:hypothetical protein
MKIEVQKLKYYYLTIPSNIDRQNNIKKNFKDYDLTEINPVINNVSKFQSGSTGFSRMIYSGLKNQKKDMPFQPFVLLEDDISKYREFPEYIEVPDDSDILYIGTSTYGTDNNSSYACNNILTSSVKEYPGIVKIYNMLSTHGMIILSMLGALACQKAMSDAYYTNIVWDIPFAYIQPYYKVYSLIEPLVYQDETVGGCESATKQNINLDLLDKPLPSNMFNTTNYSIITSNKI